MATTRPDHETVRAALALAMSAPSIHNTQPWRWRVGDHSVQLYADTDRWLPATDPDERDLLVSCGAALHHARVALAASGWAGRVHRMPNPAEPNHVASIELHPHEPETDELAMATAIPYRRSDRRPYAAWPVPHGWLSEYTARAAKEGVVLELVDEPYARSVLVNAIEEADRLQRANPAYVGEIHRWSGRSGASEEGVLAANASDAETYGDLRLRVFDGTPHRGGLSEDDGAAGELLVLGTASDDAESRLRAGEATSAVLLAATADGLATCPLSQALEIGSTRAVVGEINGAGIVPQMVLRIGWPTLAGHPLARTPRRHIDDVIGLLE